MAEDPPATLDDIAQILTDIRDSLNTIAEHVAPTPVPTMQVEPRLACTADELVEAMRQYARTGLSIKDLG